MQKDKNNLSAVVAIATVLLLAISLVILYVLGIFV